jgi:regulation of enolase protein 1 (concanavalin A-like superfamily)
MTRFPQGFWLNPPSVYQAADDCITLTTEPGTDSWQRTYYGFQNNNAHAHLWNSFDQAGVLVWVDQFNWIKVSLEYEDESLSRLGAVVTNNGYSDWSTRNCEARGFIQYRVSQRGPDFLLEANEGGDWEQLRVCHLAVLGETTADMGTLNATHLPAVPVSVGVYACSPGESSVEVEFDNIQYESSQWEFHL